MASFKEAMEFSGKPFFLKAPLCAITGLEANGIVCIICLLLAQDIKELAIIAMMSFFICIDTRMTKLSKNGSLTLLIYLNTSEEMGNRRYRIYLMQWFDGHQSMYGSGRRP
jgi:hypothetical protein